MALTALITRPEEDARPLAEALAARGVATMIEPLLAIRPLPSAPALLASDLQDVQALLFTSANGARAFAELSPRRDIGVLAVGDATASTARALGFAAVESAGGDVRELATLVKQRLRPAGGPLFHAAGSAVAGDLAQLLAADGFELRRRMLYEALPAESFGPQARSALLDGGIDLVLLFSPRTALTFANLAEAAGVETRNLTALCLSRAVATAISDRPWRAVKTAARPDLPSMLELVDRQMQGNPETQSTAPTPSQPPAAVKGPMPIPPKPAPVERGGAARVFLAGLIGAVLAAGAVLAVSHFAPESIGIAPSPVAGAASAVTTDQMADLSAKLAALQQQVAAEKTAGATAQLPPEITGLPTRIANLESRVAEIKPAALPDDLAGLPARVGALEQHSSAATSSADAAAMSQLQSDAAALSDRLKAAETALSDLAALKKEVAALSAGGGVALAIAQLHDLIAAGKPFAAALDSLAKVAAGDQAMTEALAPSLASLRAHGDSGVATLADLQDSFPAAADAILHAMVPSDVSAANASFTDRVLARLASLVSIRPVGDSAGGDDPPARVARAEARLGAGDIESAVGELTALPPGAAADAAKPWLDRANARLDAERALDKLRAAAIAVLSASAAQ
jgi:uroporphyrinogen-III synthase